VQRFPAQRAERQRVDQRALRLGHAHREQRQEEGRGGARQGALAARRLQRFGRLVLERGAERVQGADGLVAESELLHQVLDRGAVQRRIHRNSSRESIFTVVWSRVRRMR
jgi:hypothetical protein